MSVSSLSQIQNFKDNFKLYCQILPKLVPKICRGSGKWVTGDTTCTETPSDDLCGTKALMQITDEAPPSMLHNYLHLHNYVHIPVIIRTFNLIWLHGVAGSHYIRLRAWALSAGNWYDPGCACPHRGSASIETSGASSTSSYIVLNLVTHAFKQ